jgi:hypothetical protein
MSTIHCKVTPYEINTWVILRLPETTSKKLPSRGQVMVECTINGYHFQTPLEPDGKWCHWFTADPELMRNAHITVDSEVVLDLGPIKTWPEPNVPTDFTLALEKNPAAYALWRQVTPMARWEWIRWMRATNKLETRNRRIEVGMSKLTSGERRPCCWNRNLCTEPSVSKNGVLLDPIPTAV